MSFAARVLLRAMPKKEADGRFWHISEEPIDCQRVRFPRYYGHSLAHGPEGKNSNIALLQAHFSRVAYFMQTV
jgi:hypothetical protein